MEAETERPDQTSDGQVVILFNNGSKGVISRSIRIKRKQMSEPRAI